MLASVWRPISTGGVYDGINPVVPYFDGLMDKAWATIEIAKKDISKGIVFGAIGLVLGIDATWGGPSASLGGKVSLGISLIALLLSISAFMV